MTIHSFALHPDHARYLAAIIVLMMTCGASATVLRMVFPKTPYSLLILMQWAIFFLVALNADYVEIAPLRRNLCAGAAAAVAALFLFVRRSLSGRNFFAVYREVNSIGELSFVLFAWMGGLFIITAPLAFGFPPGTLISSHFICNDSVVHSLMADGLASLRSLHIDPFYYSAAPRAGHSFTYYFNSLITRLPTSRIILPAMIANFSLVTLWADSFLRTVQVRGMPIAPQVRFLICLVSVSSFLLLSTVYTIFFGQLSALAFTLAAVTVVLLPTAFGERKQSVVLASILSLAGFAAYGVFSASLVGLSAALAGGLAFVQHRNTCSFGSVLSRFFRELLSPRWICFLLICVLLTWPSIRFALYVLKVQGSGTLGSDLSSAVGNLPDGYLSPLHLSGIWPPGAGYREGLLRQWSPAAHVLMAVIFCQVALIATAGFSLRTLLLLGVFAVPMLTSTIAINSPYVHFKYFTYLIVPFVVLASAGLALNLARLFTGPLSRAASWITMGILAIYCWVAVGWSLPTYSVIPALLQGHFLSFEALANSVKEKRALVLSKEDWILYYTQQDDFVPLTLYIPRAFNSESIDTVVVDRAYMADAQDYLKRFPKLLALVKEQRCKEVVADRFELFSARCETAPAAESLK